MIRINLLPYHEKAKKESQTKQLIIISGSLLLFLLLIGGVHLWITTSVSSLESDVKAREAKIQELDKKIGEVKTIEAEKKVLEKKLGSSELRRTATTPCASLPMWPVSSHQGRLAGSLSGGKSLRWKARHGTTLPWCGSSEHGGLKVHPWNFLPPGSWRSRDQTPTVRPPVFSKSGVWYGNHD